MEYPFVVDLRDMIWHEDFNGRSFGLRHMFSVKISRPWYTFNVETFSTIGLYVLSNPPAMNSHSPPSTPSSSFDSNLSNPNSKGFIKIKDCGGLIGLNFGSSSDGYLDMSNQIPCSFRVSGQTTPLSSANLILLQAEIDSGFFTIISFSFSYLSFIINLTFTFKYRTNS